jgi:hypothetical protein
MTVVFRVGIPLGAMGKMGDFAYLSLQKANI